MSILTKVLSTGENKKTKVLSALVPHINSLEPKTQALSDTELQAKTVEFRGRIERGESLEDLLVEAFAVVREASSRIIGQRHYDVQMMGGAALHFGWVAEMKTGEGKTLVSTLPVYLNGLTGQGVHVVTVNDYLAARDSEWMGQIHRWLGLTMGLILSGQSDASHRKAQYDADITYGTNNEMGFDYLRDNMSLKPENIVQRGHKYCIVDEVDSILVDEARTPLIISGHLGDASKIYYKFAAIVAGLQEGLDYEFDEEKRSVVPLESGITIVEGELEIDNLYDSVQHNYVHQLQAALRAKELYLRDKDYVVQNGEVKIVDEFTGRILDGRRWSEGLHQAVEAKEGVNIKEENQTLATVTLQNYFRLYEKLAGMTGTALTEANELFSTYALEVVPIETNKPLIRKDEPDYIYRTEDIKFQALAEDILRRNKLGQPILVGTISVERSEKLSDLLNRLGVKHEVLNAKQHTREAEIVAQAGRPGAVTVATNMAGRGVDIVLGGNFEALALRDFEAEGLSQETEEGKKRFDELLAHHKEICEKEAKEVLEAGGLYVLGTERHESRRIDNQLRGRSGRQGDPGESRFYLSLEDDLMRVFATGAMNWVMARTEDDQPIISKMVTKAVERAQNTVEQKNAESRRNVLKYDEVMNEQRKVIYARRHQLLTGQDIKVETLEAISKVINTTADLYCQGDNWDMEGLLAEVKNTWGTELEEAHLVGNKEDLVELLIEDAEIRHKEREEKNGEEEMRQLEGFLMLQLIDQHWREHLYDMDYLREGINLRAIGQKDPLIEWQREAFDSFGEMMDSMLKEFVTYVMHTEIAEPETAEPALVGVSESKEGVLDNPAISQPKNVVAEGSSTTKTIVREEEDKIGRNDPCHCDSGKKYKHCHGK